MIPKSAEMDLDSQLKDFFGQGERRVVLIGVGETLRGDDGVGVQIIELLKDTKMDRVLLLNTGVVPEAFTGKVVQYNPTHVLLLDAAHFRGEVGEVRLIEASKISGQTISTHSLPLSIFISYIEQLGSKVLLLGVQPKNIEFYSEMSPEVSETAKKIANVLARILS